MAKRTDVVDVSGILMPVQPKVARACSMLGLPVTQASKPGAGRRGGKGKAGKKKA